MLLCSIDLMGLDDSTRPLPDRKLWDVNQSSVDLAGTADDSLKRHWLPPISPVPQGEAGGAIPPRSALAQFPAGERP